MYRHRRLHVLLPYRFTLFSNLLCHIRYCVEFYYLIDLHYSQTFHSQDSSLQAFYYLIDLHYSQTIRKPIPTKNRFYYLIDLHYSQTFMYSLPVALMFYYLIDLHYSQTSNLKLGIKCTHYTVHGKSIRLFYNICIMTVNKIRTNHYQSQQGVPCCNPALMFS